MQATNAVRKALEKVSHCNFHVEVAVTASELNMFQLQSWQNSDYLFRSLDIGNNQKTSSLGFEGYQKAAWKVDMA